MKKENVILIIVCVIIVILGLIFMPSIYNYINERNLNNNEINVETEIEKEKEDVKENITLKSEILKELVYPIMHNDNNTKDTYYSLNRISVLNLSNNDILYNAFLQIYPGYFEKVGSLGCTNNSIKFSANYIDLRIQNIFGNKVKYNLTDFKVPTGSFSDYIGTFKYDSFNKQFIYYGNCENTNKNTKYYDVGSIYDVSLSDNKNTLHVYYYVAFVKVENGKYTLYSDYNYTKEISSGNFESLEKISSMISKLKVNKYEYTFKKDICNYDSYCFYEGKWMK